MNNQFDGGMRDVQLSSGMWKIILNRFHGDECESEEDVITDYLVQRGPPSSRMESASGQQGGAPPHGGPLVPIISVTPHSPAGKHYPVLEENLQQLHEIHETIQQMRDVTTVQALSNQLARLTQQCARLSASCPSLNDLENEQDPLSSVNSSPTHTLPPPNNITRKRSSGEWQIGVREDGEVMRRRSWAALEDLTNSKDSCRADRQRSISLSSLESENDDPFSESTANLLGAGDGAGASVVAGAGVANGGKGGRRGSGRTGRQARTAGTSSTHSLNEADLQNDFMKVVAKREAECRLLQARLPLQKSISTPSILAARDLAPGVPVIDGANATLSVGCQLRPSGTESETEEDMLASLLDADKPDTHLSLQYHLFNAVYDDHQEKRRKRGSLFFRKKKDKSKKQSHQWVSVCYGSSHLCDWCSKPLTNKPALYCENCAVTVHQNSCKEHVAECSKSKGGKNTPKQAQNQSNSSKDKSSAKRNSSCSSQGQAGSPSRRTTLCYSPWRRVATKLGVNQIINEEKDDHYHHAQHHHQEGINSSDETASVTFEFLDESPVTAHDLDTDPFLGLQDEEPDSWSPTVSKDITKKLKEKEIKRQEHIYEFILTEKHHCLTLRVMQKVFVEGLEKYFQLGPNVSRMFPRLSDLTDIHLRFLHRLRQRQRQAPVVETIGDVLLEQFSGQGAVRLKAAYGEFCSRHRDAVDIYKDYLHHDRRFGEFIKHCQANPLLKKKGIPECILFVTQRLTKYPLLIEPLIKTSKDNKLEQEKLSKALALVKEILVEVDAQVAEKEKEDRKLEIYNRIEAKSFTVHRGLKFKKSDILSNNRRLRFEGCAMLMQGRGKMHYVLVIVLSDVLFFLMENNHKYTFFTPDNKAGVVSLQKLLVREKAGQESRGIYLISSNPTDPEMFELKVQKPKEKQVWIQAVRDAVQNCPEDDEDVSPAFSSEERQRLLDAKQSQIRQIVGFLRQKDMEQALILEDKMALQLRLVAAAAGAGVGVGVGEAPSYCHLVSEETDTTKTWKEVLSALQKVNQLASSLYASGTNLSRSVSSVGEHQSEAYVSPTLPKRAETFGGFDNANANANKDQASALNKNLLKKQHQQQLQQLQKLQQQQLQQLQQLQQQQQQQQQQQMQHQQQQQQQQQHHYHQTAQQQLQSSREPSFGSSPVSTPDSALPHQKPKLSLDWSAPPDLPALLSLGHEQQLAAMQLSHHVYTLTCIISQQMTSIESLQAQLSACKSQVTGEDGGRGGRPMYRHNHQLEELRNLQDKLTQEKECWQRERESEEKELEERREQLLRLQEQVRSEQTDVVQQREQLYRKLETLAGQGILIGGPNLGAVTSPGSGSDAVPSPSDERGGSSDGGDPSSPSTPTDHSRRKMEAAKWKHSSAGKASTLPLNLISATNQQKVASSVQIKQQLPLKLASKLGGGGGGGGTLPAGGGGIQQMLPLKLSQSQAEAAGGGTRRSGGAGAVGYQRLSSSSFSPPDPHPLHPPAPSHSRTGSSPAMMQNIEGGGEGRGGAKAGRTHTYPKLPDRFKVRSPDSTNSPSSTPHAAEEEVIFF
ncbi:A-kinase anchor protein 13 isoform X2 [Nilaparvata lugens]|uniref:A-kinase anchor protein 13 isoform X2 n=1 Tax=Nilaparvata lugens TaxID=108931 RepID=UPI00193DEAED|nr:A-kinase anchor protein 13 isoform X2 [Nilaparvata lugens]